MSSIDELILSSKELSTSRKKKKKNGLSLK